MLIGNAASSAATGEMLSRWAVPADSGGAWPVQREKKWNRNLRHHNWIQPADNHPLALVEGWHFRLEPSIRPNAI